jgi:hypothetical protein
MLHGTWCGAGEFSAVPAKELPERCRTTQDLRLYFVVKTGSRGLSRQDLGMMKNDLRRDVLTYAKVLGMRCRTVALTDPETAADRYRLPISLLRPPDPGS